MAVATVTANIFIHGCNVGIQLELPTKSQLFGNLEMLDDSLAFQMLGILEVKCFELLPFGFPSPKWRIFDRNLEFQEYPTPRILVKITHKQNSSPVILECGFRFPSEDRPLAEKPLELSI